MLLSSWNRKYQPYPLSYFSVVVCLWCLLRHILSIIAYTLWENRDFVFIIIVQIMMSANKRIRFGLQIVFVCLYITPSHYYHCYPLYNIRGCVFSVYPFPLWWLREYTLCLIIIKSEVWTIIHCLGLGHETMVCAVCLSIFLLVQIMAVRQTGKKPLSELMIA